MYAIRSKRTNRWYGGINHKAGNGSSHRLIMSEIPQLFQTKDLARIEMIMQQMNNTVFDLVEVDLRVMSN